MQQVPGWTAGMPALTLVGWGPLFPQIPDGCWSLKDSLLLGQESEAKQTQLGHGLGVLPGERHVCSQGLWDPADSPAFLGAYFFNMCSSGVQEVSKLRTTFVKKSIPITCCEICSRAINKQALWREADGLKFQTKKHTETRRRKSHTALPWAGQEKSKGVEFWGRQFLNMLPHSSCAK